MGEEAHNIRGHAPLPLDENFGDTRQMLARMAILANEMLISVELQLSRGLMSKRLESKVATEQLEVFFNNNLKENVQCHLSVKSTLLATVSHPLRKDICTNLLLIRPCMREYYDNIASLPVRIQQRSPQSYLRVI